MLIAPVSARIPCEQEILQGNLRFSGSIRREIKPKPLCGSDFLEIPSQLQGISLRDQGIPQQEQRIPFRIPGISGEMEPRPHHCRHPIRPTGGSARTSVHCYGDTPLTLDRNDLPASHRHRVLVDPYRDAISANTALNVALGLIISAHLFGSVR